MKFLSNWRISQRLPAVVIGLAMLMASGVGVASYLISADVVDSLTRRHLETIAYERSVKVSEYLRLVSNDLIVMAKSNKTISAIHNLESNWAALEGDRTAILHEAYISKNPKPAGERYLFDGPDDFVRYHFTHKQIQSGFRNDMQARGYADMLLLDPDGNVIYSVAKENDFATNTSKTKGEEALLEAFKKAMALPAGGVAVVDFSNYEPAGSVPAAFFATRIEDGNAKPAGVFAIRIDLRTINAIMQERHGLGETGETLLVGADHKVRSRSAFEDGGQPLVTVFDAAAVDGAINGTPSEGTYDGYRDLTLAVATVPVDFNDIKLAVVALVSDAEASGPVAKMRDMMLIVGSVLLIVVAIMGYLFSRSITGPLGKATGGVKDLAAGQLEIKIFGTERRDEIGDMARALTVFRNNALEAARIEAESKQQQAAVEVERMSNDAEKRAGEAQIHFAVNSLAQGLERLAAGNLSEAIETPFSGHLDKLRINFNSSLTRLSDTLIQLCENAMAIQANGAAMRHSADTLSRRTETQAASLEETAAAVDEITVTVRSSAARAHDANAIVGSTKQNADASTTVVANAINAMSRIEDASTKIEQIIDVIDEIAFQTNLLALNAGIEAARAGESGKGFAVVAMEVRELAQRSADAAREIKTLIDAATSEVSHGVSHVQETGRVLSQISDQISEISHHVSAITTAAADQCTGLQEVNGAVNQMDQMTQANAAIAEENSALSQQLADEADGLMALIAQFKLANSDLDIGVARAA